MTDRELLELAARAYGIMSGWYIENFKPICDVGSPKTWGIAFDIPLSGGYACWNPLVDDGDALRLAVKLELTISSCVFKGLGEFASYVSSVYDERLSNARGNDAMSVCRRAIVEAAAKIAKSRS